MSDDKTTTTNTTSVERETEHHQNISYIQSFLFIIVLTTIFLQVFQIIPIEVNLTTVALLGLLVGITVLHHIRELDIAFGGDSGIRTRLVLSDTQNLNDLFKSLGIESRAQSVQTSNPDIEYYVNDFRERMYRNFSYDPTLALNNLQNEITDLITELEQKIDMDERKDAQVDGGTEIIGLDELTAFYRLSDTIDKTILSYESDGIDDAEILLLLELCFQAITLLKYANQEYHTRSKQPDQGSNDSSHPVPRDMTSISLDDENDPEGIGRIQYETQKEEIEPEQFSTRVEAVLISDMHEVFEAAGDDAINLGLSQPDFSSPDHVRWAAIEAIESGVVDGYTSNKGTLELREAIAAKYDRDYSLAIDPDDHLIATSGGSEALHLALEAHVDLGEEVLFPDPGFVSYEALTRIAGGTPRPLPLREDLTLDPATVEEAITDETAVFVVNSPANPTGAVQSETDMREFARIADEYDVLCISDEVYEHIVFEGEHRSPLEFAESDNVVVVSACSKTYSMAGWRLGWVAGSTRRIERMLRVHQYVQACASAPAQYAAEAALTGPQEGVEQMVEVFNERRDLLLEGLDDMGLETSIPKGAFYAMPKVPDGWVDEVIERGVIIVPGEVFGKRGADYARISYATETEDLKEAIEVMREATQAVR